MTAASAMIELRSADSGTWCIAASEMMWARSAAWATITIALRTPMTPAKANCVRAAVALAGEPASTRLARERLRFPLAMRQLGAGASVGVCADPEAPFLLGNLCSSKLTGVRDPSKSERPRRCRKTQ